MDKYQIAVPTEKNGRAEQLQFLRFLAFFCVYVAHAEVWLFFRFPSVNCSTCAVGFFFVLSGFVSGWSAYGRDYRFGWKEYGRNLRKKVSRIYPLYCITMLIPALTSGVLQQLASLNFGGDVFQLLKNLLMIQSWFPEGSMTFNGVGWYVSTLMFLNLLNYPVLCLFTGLKRRRWRILLFSGCIGGILFCTAVYCYLTKSWDLGYWHYVFPPARMGEYLAGIALGYLVSVVHQGMGRGKQQTWLFTVLEISVLLLWFRFMYIFGSPWRVHILNWLIPNILLISVFALGRGWVSRLFCLRPLVKLGDISYECFLIHNLLVVRLAITCTELAESTAGKVTGFVACLLLTIVISLYLNAKQKGAGKKA